MDILSTMIDLFFRDAFPAALLMGLALFVVRSVWPWFSTEYWPSLRDREERRTVAQENLIPALVDLKSIAESTAHMVAQHDILIRDIAYRLSGTAPPALTPTPGPTAGGGNTPVTPAAASSHSSAGSQGVAP